MEKRQKMENQKVGYTTKDWMLRFVKGMFIGSGFILPGVSGGALAAVFGMYERLISFLAHLTNNFKENVLFFLPVGLGGVTGIFLLSFLSDVSLELFLRYGKKQGKKEEILLM